MLEIELVEESLGFFRKAVEREKRNGRAEIEERALVLRETTRFKERAATLLESCIVLQDGRKRFNVDKVCTCRTSVRILNDSLSYVFVPFKYKTQWSGFTSK